MLKFLDKFFNPDKWEKDETEKRENKMVVDDLNYIRSRLENIRAAYDMVSDEELVDALIFEEKALMSRFSYLLRVARERGISNIPSVSA